VSRSDFNRYLLLGDVVVSTATWTLCTKDGSPDPGPGCEPLPLRLLAILAAAPGREVERAELEAAWPHRPDRRTFNNAVSKMLRWAEGRDLIERRAPRAFRGVYSVHWRVEPRTSARAPWQTEAQLFDLQTMLRDSPLPTYVTDYATDPSEMRVVWANHAFLSFVGWESCQGRTVLDVIDRVASLFTPAVCQQLDKGEAETFERTRRGLDRHKLGPFPFDRSRLRRFGAGGGGCASGHWTGTSFAQFVRAGDGNRSGAIVQYIFTRDGVPSVWGECEAEGVASSSSGAEEG